MKDYLDKGKEVLSVLTNSGYQAYMIGGVVRNTILELDFQEIDITTSANPDTVRKCFPNAAIEKADESSVRLLYAGYHFNIGSFRAIETEKQKGKKDKKTRSHYSKSLEDDLEWRDFTINAIAMSHGGKLTDAYNGYQDLNKRIIRAIGPAKTRFNEDPIRMFRAFRFVSELGFKIEGKTFAAIRSQVKQLSTLSVESLGVELVKMLQGEYFKKAIRAMRDAGAFKHLPIIGKEFKRLSDKFAPTDLNTVLACAFVKAKAIESEELLGFVENPEFVKKTVHLALVSPKAKYTVLQLYSNGLEVCLLANKVNKLLGKGKSQEKAIRKAYEALPIKQVCDLTFKGEDIMKMREDIPKEYVQTIVDNMVNKVLHKEMLNEAEALRIFALASLREMGLLVGVEVREGMEDLPEEVSLQTTTMKNLQEEESPEFIEDFKSPVNTSTAGKPVSDTFRQSENQVDKDYSDLKMDQIERKIYDQEERMRVKDQKIMELERQALRQKMEQDISEIVSQNVELLKDLKYLKKDTEALVVKRELKGVYRSLLKNVDPKLKQLSEEKHEEED